MMDFAGPTILFAGFCCAYKPFFIFFNFVLVFAGYTIFNPFPCWILLDIQFSHISLLDFVGHTTTNLFLVQFYVGFCWTYNFHTFPCWILLDTQTTNFVCSILFQILIVRVIAHSLSNLKGVTDDRRSYM